MNEYFKKPVMAFGMVAPLLLILVLVLAVFYGLSVLNKEYLAKKSVYDKAEMARKHTLELQGSVAMNNDKLVGWEKLLTSENRGTFIEHWKLAEKKFTGKELTRSPHNWINYSEGIGKGLHQPSSQVSIPFSATYRAMQLAMMEVESKLPQMQLDSMTMTPEGNSGRINFKTQFTVWTKQ